MKKWMILIIAALGILFTSLSVFVVWIPDIFSDSRHTVASLVTNGHSFTVVQYWNHADFYSTELHHRFPDGHTTMDTLDGDDMKSWRIPIAVDENKRIVSITLSGHRRTTVSY